MSTEGTPYKLQWSDFEPELMKVTYRGVLDLVLVWASIFGVAAVASRFLSPDLTGVLVTAAAILVIGTLQNGLASLSHHAVHYNLHPDRKINDSLFRWMLAAPMGQSFLTLRREHLRHHSRFAENDDPERFYYDLDIHNRRSPGAFIARTAGMFLGLVVASQLQRILSGNRGGALATGQKDERESRGRREFLYALPAQAVLFGAFYLLTDNLLGYFIYWAIPLVTVGAGLNALRATIEHADPDEPPTNYRSFHFNPIEKMIVGSFNFNLHYEHHRFMSVPYYKVGEVKKRMLAANDYAGCRIERSYLSRYAEILKKLRTHDR